MSEKTKERLSIYLTVLQYPTIGEVLRSYVEGELTELLKDLKDPEVTTDSTSL